MRKLKVSYQKHTSKKARDRLKALIIGLIVLAVVIAFIALVVGLSLGLKKSASCFDTDSNTQPCGSNGACLDVRYDNNNCGNCGVKCPFLANCQGSACKFCTFNCSTDGNMCTLEPCNATAGCKILDCNNDGNACTTGTCNSTTGCVPVDCANDGDVCSIPPCTPPGGCAVFDCNTDTDPCTELPCNKGIGCTIVCPILVLNPPTVNWTTSVPRVPGGVPIVSAGATLASPPNIVQLNITLTPISGANPFTATLGSLTSNYDPATGIYEITGIATAGIYQAVLRSVRFTTASPITATFFFSVTNAKPFSLQSPVKSTIMIT